MVEDQLPGTQASFKGNPKYVRCKQLLIFVALFFYHQLAYFNLKTSSCNLIASSSNYKLFFLEMSMLSQKKKHVFPVSSETVPICIKYFLQTPHFKP